MAVDPAQVKSLFLELAAVEDLTARAARLRERCGSDAELFARVHALLVANDRVATDEGTATVTAGPVNGPDVETADFPGRDDRVGTVLGDRYKLLQELGEGGMGTVFLADQLAPVRRRVAVKIIKVGMDSSRVLARFAAERQALALMDHPNIAKVLDAGTAGSGRPFFVMELVRGVPLTQFCDQHKLPVLDRLNLFVQICSAVQHAHQKGIIHRDLKPTNILVESHDGKPVPKVIDFGLAKATSGIQLTEATLFTGLGQVAGTPLYMAPEQATFNALDVDTRADVYALGVILYELLTDTTPIERVTFKKAAFDEMMRLIREYEPATPSSRLSDSESKASVAAVRQTEPAKLGRFVRGELDWIVMKALSKERDRRYETATAFAQDVERFLNHEPVQAGPAGAQYRLRKFVRRNRGRVLAAGLVLAALVAGTAGTTVGLIRAEHHRRLADAERGRAEQAEADTLADYRASTDDAIEQLIGSKPDLGPQERAYLENTLKRWQAFAARQGDDARNRAIRAEGHVRVAIVLAKLGHKEEAVGEDRIARALQRQLVDQFPAIPEYRQDLGHTCNYLGILLKELGQRDEARAEYEAARDLQTNLLDQSPGEPAYRQDLANTRHNLGFLLADLGQRDEARVEYLAARDLRTKLVEEFPTVAVYRQGLAVTHNNMGLLLISLGRRDDARREYEAARDLRSKLVEQFPAVPAYRQDLAGIRNNLGILLKDLGRRDEARVEYEAARDLQTKLVGQFPAVPAYQHDLGHSHLNLALLLNGQGKREEAVVEYQASRDLRKRLVEQFPAVPEYQQDLARTRNSLGSVLGELGKRAEAQSECEAARDLRRRLVEQFPAMPGYQLDLANSHNNLGNLFKNLGNPGQAREEYTAARDLQRRLVDRFPAVPLYQQQLAGTHYNLGQLFDDLRQRVEARVAFETARDILIKMVERFPAVPAYKENLASAHNELGLLLKDLGKGEAAGVEYLAAIRLKKELAEQFPAVTGYRIGLGGSYGNYAGLIRSEGKPADSLEWFDLAVRTLKPSLDGGRAGGTAKLYLRNTYWGRAIAYDELRRFGEAVADWEQAVNLSQPVDQPGFRASRANARLRAGKVVDAVAEVAELTKTSTWTAGQWYDFACIYARAGDNISAKKQEYADRAMELLAQAVKGGYTNAAHLATDVDLESLHARDDFKALVQSLPRPKAAGRPRPPVEPGPPPRLLKPGRRPSDRSPTPSCAESLSPSSPATT